MSDAAASSAPRSGSSYRIPEVEQLLDRVTDLIDTARPMPLSTSVVINKEEILDLLAEVRSRLPEELRAARWLLKEREEFLEKVKREGEDLLEEARSQAERMVQRTEVVKAAEQRGRQIVEKAEARSRQMRHEAEDFVDQKLGSFEIALERVQAQVAAGREKLQSVSAPPASEQQDDLADVAQFGAHGDERTEFFDQEQ
jgi:cell division septum initiation protein DivIVA